MRWIAVLEVCGLLAMIACGSSPPRSGAQTDAARCSEVARHTVAIGPTERWIAEGRRDELLPIEGASDREALTRLFELACRENWPSHRDRCVLAQRTWSDVERACESNKVWWHEPR